MAFGFPLGRPWKIALWAVSSCLVIVVGTMAYSWYSKHYAWPRRIQIEVLGEVIVSHDALRKFEGDAHFGQGMFRWTYDAPSAAGSAWAKYCASQDLKACSFVKLGTPEDQVETSVSYKDGVVTIEEWWL